MRDKLALSDTTAILRLPIRVRRELERLLRRELEAWRGKDVASAITARLLWVELYLHASSVHAPDRQVRGLPRISNNLQRQVDLLSKHRPGTLWKRRQQAAPKVAVVGLREESYKLPWDLESGSNTGVCYVELLACGHERDGFVTDPRQVARHRLCYECADLRLSLADKLLREAPRQEPKRLKGGTK